MPSEFIIEHHAVQQVEIPQGGLMPERLAELGRRLAESILGAGAHSPTVDRVTAGRAAPEQRLDGQVFLRVKSELCEAANVTRFSEDLKIPTQRAADQLLAKVASLAARAGCRSFSSAFASI
jgi:hypothetical protein